MLTNQEIGQRMRMRRHELGLTLQDVARELGVQNSTILRYEKGQVRKIKLPVIESIASALQVSPAWLIGKSDDPHEGVDNTTQTELGDRIKQRRKELGLTLEEVGNAVGVGKSTVKKWETGFISNMRRDKIPKLAAVLQTTPEDLMVWEPQGSAVDDLMQTLSSLDLLTEDKKSHFSLATMDNPSDYTEDRAALAFALLGYGVRKCDAPGGQLRVTDLRTGKTCLLPRKRFGKGSESPKERAKEISNSLDAEKNHLYDLYQKADGRDQALVWQILSRYEDDQSRVSGDYEPDPQR